MLRQVSEAVYNSRTVTYDEFKRRMGSSNMERTSRNHNRFFKDYDVESVLTAIYICYRTIKKREPSSNTTNV